LLPTVEIKIDAVTVKKIEAGGAKVVKRKTWSLFKNSDEENCPVLEYVLTDDSGNALSSAVADIVTIDEEGTLFITEANFSPGRGTIKLYVKARTAFEEDQLNIKEIWIEEMNDCDFSRKMK